MTTPLLKNQMKMKAVHIYFPCEGRPTMLHTDVEEVPQEEKQHLSRREFRCRHCGASWVESLTSPIILEKEVENHLGDYYENIIYCQQGK